MSGPAFLAVILGLGVPVVFLITLFIQSDAQVPRRSGPLLEASSHA